MKKPRLARVLIVGGGGLIGSALARTLPEKGFDVRTTNRLESDGLRLELTEPGSWPDFHGFDAAVIVAALARLGDCDRNPERSRQINAVAPRLLAELFAKRGTRVLHLSTDKVFDGSRALRGRSEPTNPKTVYGRHKAEAESAVLARGGAVLRLSKVLSPDLPLLQNWGHDLTAGRPIQPFSDMRLAPITVGFVVDLIARLIEDRAAGIFQVTGAEDRPYAALAAILAEALGAAPELVQPVPTPPTLAAIPHVAHSTLEMSRETERYGFGNPTFEAVVGEVAADVRSGIA